MTTYTITGRPAITVAELLGLTLCKHADPTDDTQTRAAGLSVAEARAIAAEDPSLIWIDTSAVAEAVDNERIRALRTEALDARDWVQASICDRALGVDVDDLGAITYATRDQLQIVVAMTREEARARCAVAIAGARSMEG